MEFSLNISLILPAAEEVVPRQAIEVVEKLNELFKLRGIRINLHTDAGGETLLDGTAVRLEYHNADTLAYDILLEADTRCGHEFSDVIYIGNSSIIIEGEKVVQFEAVRYFAENGLLSACRSKLQDVDPKDEESPDIMALRKQLFQLELLFFNYDLFRRSVRNASNPVKDTVVTDQIMAVYNNVFNSGAEVEFSMERVLEGLDGITEYAQAHSNTEELLAVLKLYSEFLIIAEELVRAQEILVQYHKIYEESTCPKSFQLQQQRVTCLYFMASVLFGVKEFDRSLEAFQRTVDSAVLLLGEYHPDILYYLHVYAGVYEMAGRYADSVKVLEQLTGKIEHIYGRNSVQYAIGVNNMAFSSYEDGNYDQAVEYYLESAGILESQQNVNVELLCTINDNLANCFLEKEQCDKAMEYALKNHSLRGQMFLEESAEMADSHMMLGKCHYALGEVEEALEMYRKALPVFLRNYGSKERIVLATYSNMASCYLDLANYDEAEKCLLKTLQMQKLILGEEHVETSTTYNKLGFLYSDTGRMEEAIAHYKKTLEIRRKTLREYHPDISNILTNIGHFYAQQEEWDMAYEHFNESLDITRRNFGPTHKKTRSLCIATVDACWGMGKFDQVVELLEKVLRDCSRVSEKSDDEQADIAWFHHTLGLAYENVDEFKKALANYIKAFTIRKTLYGDEHPHTVSSYEAFVLVQSVFVPYSGKLQ